MSAKLLSFLQIHKTRLEAINRIEVKPDRNYGWVWDYAKFRLGHSTANIKAAEGKAESLLKLAISTAGAAWVLLIYSASRLPLSASDATTPLFLWAWVLLGVVAVCALLALLPLRRLAPFKEEVAIRFVNKETVDESQEPLGRFSLGLMLCSDHYERLTSWKSYCVIVGSILLLLAIVCFTLGFSSVLSRSASLHSNLRVETDFQLLLQPQAMRWASASLVPATDSAEVVPVPVLSEVA